MTTATWAANTTAKTAKSTLAGTEELRINDAGTSKKTTPAYIKDYMIGLALTWSALQTMSGGVRAKNGSVSDCGFQINGAANYGLFYNNTFGFLSVSIGGGEYVSMGAAAGVTINHFAGGGFKFGNPTSSPDTGLYRAEVGVLSLCSGATATGGTTRAIANSPTTISANVNDYASGSIKSKFQRWASDASRNVTGLTFGGNQVDGQEHVIVNVGSNDIVLKNQDAASAAANRFLCSTGADITLSANQAADIIYDGTQSRWLVFKRN